MYRHGNTCTIASTSKITPLGLYYVEAAAWALLITHHAYDSVTGKGWYRSAKWSVLSRTGLPINHTANPYEPGESQTWNHINSLLISSSTSNHTCELSGINNTQSVQDTFIVQTCKRLRMESYTVYCTSVYCSVMCCKSAKCIKTKDDFTTTPILTAGSLYFTSREGLRGS